MAELIADSSPRETRTTSCWNQRHRQRVAGVLVTSRPERIGALVLTPSDSYERFFPPLFRFLQLGGRLPGFPYALAQSLRLRVLHRLPTVFGLLSKRPLSREPRGGGGPMQRDPAVQGGLGKLLAGVDSEHTAGRRAEVAAASPGRCCWPGRRRTSFFPISLAERHLAAFPGRALRAGRGLGTRSCRRTSPRGSPSCCASLAWGSPDRGRLS